MMEPIQVPTTKPTGHKEVMEEWSYERIMEIWGEEDMELTPQLARRCQSLEAEVTRLEGERDEARSLDQWMHRNRPWSGLDERNYIEDNPWVSDE